MTKFIVKKGNHFCTPRRFKIWLKPINKTFTWKLKFTESCKYVFPYVDGKPHSDQWDWNKIGGIDLDSPLSTMAHSIMGGWRYNPLTEKIELNAYFHNGKGTENRVMSPALISLEPEQEVYLQIYLEKDEWVVTYALGSIKQPSFLKSSTIKPTKTSALFATEIQFYFGGNQCTPQDVSIYKERI